VRPGRYSVEHRKRRFDAMRHCRQRNARGTRAADSHHTSERNSLLRGTGGLSARLYAPHFVLAGQAERSQDSGALFGEVRFVVFR
jgi:hypothetical protein